MFFKKITICSLFLSYVLLVMAKAPTKHALLVGISEYIPSTGWVSLNAANDVDLLKNTLQQQGFNASNIHQLTNQQASQEKIIEYIQVHLIDQAQEGDIVVFHYSGHGQQIQDDNSDEEDGLDEAIVPFDSPKQFKEGEYEGEKLIRDDTLGELFLQLRKKLGKTGHLLVLMDACHSGTGTRGFNTVRGTDEIMASPIYIDSLKLHLDIKELIRMELISDTTSSLASFVTIFSSTAEQFSYEMTAPDGKNYGLLSYAFSKYVNTLEKNTSYQGLLEKITHFINNKNGFQSPQLEGIARLPVFGGGLLPPVSYFKAEEWIDNSTLLMDVGILQDIYEGTKVSFYRIDTYTRDTSSIIAKGKITHAELSKSEVQLDRPLSEEKALAAWIFITEKQAPTFPVSLKIELDSSSVLDKLMIELKEDTLTKVVTENPNLLLIKKADTIQLLSQDRFVLLNKKEPSVEDIISVCKEAACVQYYRELTVKDKRLNGTIELLKNGEPIDSLSLAIGEKFQIRITNTGEYPFYFTILDIQPDNIINVLSFDDTLVQPKKSFISPKLGLQEPSGREVFKLIMNPEPLGLSNLCSKTRGFGNKTIPFGTAGITTLVFNITEK